MSLIMIVKGSEGGFPARADSGLSISDFATSPITENVAGVNYQPAVEKCMTEILRLR
ncbi:hypothetical protein W909_03860 [Dickeya zeae EC1]|nr:hypothetical protein W909_03860 [Dickeya zeae EC1]